LHSRNHRILISFCHWLATHVSGYRKDRRCGCIADDRFSAAAKAGVVWGISCGTTEVVPFQSGGGMRNGSVCPKTRSSRCVKHVMELDNETAMNGAQSLVP
jgi:hypothetical protein